MKLSPVLASSPSPVDPFLEEAKTIFETHATPLRYQTWGKAKIKKWLEERADQAAMFETGGNFDIDPLMYGNKNTKSRTIKNKRTNFEIKIFNIKGLIILFTPIVLLKKLMWYHQN